MTKQLSPAAQNVLTAAFGSFDTYHDHSGELLAAALRAAALHCKRDSLVLYAIADELESI